MATTQPQGWIPPSQRTTQQMLLGEQAVDAMPKFFVAKQTESTEGANVKLWLPLLKLRKWITLQQQTGSCVSQGAWYVMMCLMCIEILKGDRAKSPTIFAPYHYGRGRFHGGLNGKGEGSFGWSQAKAIREDGVISVDMEGLPKPESDDPNKFHWSAETEMQWSNGKVIKEEFISEGRLHLVKSAAPVKSYEQVRDSIANGYPVTVASMRGFKMKPVVDRGKHWGVPSGQWAHQMSFLAVDDDKARPGCYCMNSWGADAHGKPADDSPAGGFWVDAEVVDSMVKQDDSFAYSQFDDFPEQKLDWFLA